ncbi:SNF2 family N-terminal domain-containing protein [Xylaria sp. FL0064]|nr:SNF2 family N-terminal domain-containing protein [Xylaria sp. FL0064]
MGTWSQTVPNETIVSNAGYSEEYLDVDRPGEQVVCFGSLSGIDGECEFAPGPRPCEREPSLLSIPAHLESCSTFSLKAEGYSRGSISTQHRQMLQAMLDEPAILLQVDCTVDDMNNDRPKRSRCTSRIITCSLTIVLYGPLSLSEELGIFFQSYDIYLQDPRHCDRDVSYCNPHRLSSADHMSLPMTSEISSMTETITGPGYQHTSALSLTSYRHQKQALTFILRRECGWDFGSSRDIWTRARGSHGYYFVNLISGSHQSKEPPQFLGGIIADPMGLGKTLTVIALVATDLQEDHFVEHEISEVEPNHATLIVVPAPFTAITDCRPRHVNHGHLTWRRHHGKFRLMDSLETQSVHLVLTTYHTVSAEWKSRRKSDQSILFSTKWKRVVLDEAHFIRNTASRMAKAICDLPSDIRWAVTGTPIQNRLSDLAALLKFLRVSPYDDTKRFDAEISYLWKSRQAEEAVNRLKTLSRCLILRRPKATINLPSRTDLRYPVNFTTDERTLYDAVKTQTIATMREASSRVTPRFVNVIQQINMMRLISQQTFDFQCETAPLTCEMCGSFTSLTETLLEDSVAPPRPLFAQCLRYICSDCVHQPQRGLSSISCGHNLPHPVATVSVNQSAFEEEAIQANIPHTSILSCAGLSSKVTALIGDLSCQTEDVKSIVFSTWRMTLDVVEQGLEKENIKHLRFDGKVPQKERKGIIDRFRNDPTVKVLLLTLTCGAVGLTLTEASRAYLMEPHWNPTMEEQALARVHRLGQKKEVTTIRFYVRDTFEEPVMELQKKKEDLAGLLLDSQTGNAEQLERLCGLL